MSLSFKSIYNLQIVVLLQLALSHNLSSVSFELNKEERISKNISTPVNFLIYYIIFTMFLIFIANFL